MGWYLKKSFRFGPLRLNLSKSGPGASVGVKGFRVSTGPKGPQINAGREGLYYRASLNPPRDPSPPAPVTGEPVETQSAVIEQDANQPGALAVASAIGFQLGARLIRGILAGLTRRR